MIGLPLGSLSLLDYHKISLLRSYNYLSRFVKYKVGSFFNLANEKNFIIQKRKLQLKTKQKREEVTN